MRQCLMLDLRDDPVLIEEYEAPSGPEVAAHMRAHGVTSMQIFRLGTRLCMVMDTDDAIFDAYRMALADVGGPGAGASQKAIYAGMGHSF